MRWKINITMEGYVDRDRMIAVTLGTSDLRLCLLKQQGLLNRRAVSTALDVTSFKILYEQATYEVHKGAYNLALQYLNKALNLNPDNVDCLTLRGICYVSLQEASLALVDIDKVLSNEGGKTARIFLAKADALYQLGDFEHALVYYYRALKRSSSGAQEEEILKGIRRTGEAIDNSLGNRSSGHFLSMIGVLSSLPGQIFGMHLIDLKMLKVQENEAQKKQKDIPVSKLPHPWIPKTSLVPKKPEKVKVKRKKKNQLLGKLSDDLDYLEGLLSDVQINCGCVGENSEICTTTNTPAKNLDLKRATEDALTFLRTREEFWSRFNPSSSAQKS